MPQHLIKKSIKIIYILVLDHNKLITIYTGLIFP